MRIRDAVLYGAIGVAAIFAFLVITDLLRPIVVAIVFFVLLAKAVLTTRSAA